MNKLQKTYMIAKAAFETAYQMRRERLAQHADLRDNDFEKYLDLDEEITAELNIDSLRDALRTAENNMVEWANNKVSKSRHFTVAHKQAMADVKANMHLPSVRTKMVDLAFRLR